MSFHLIEYFFIDEGENSCDWLRCRHQYLSIWQNGPQPDARFCISVTDVPLIVYKDIIYMMSRQDERSYLLVCFLLIGGLLFDCLLMFACHSNQHALKLHKFNDMQSLQEVTLFLLFMLHLSTSWPLCQQFAFHLHACNATYCWFICKKSIGNTFIRLKLAKFFIFKSLPPDSTFYYWLKQM